MLGAVECWTNSFVIELASAMSCESWDADSLIDVFGIGPIIEILEDMARRPQSLHGACSAPVDYLEACKL